MTREATFGSDAIQRQFSELAELLENELTVYLIGGGALTLNDLKNATKDIDLIVRERGELQRLYQILTAAGYEPEEEVADDAAYYAKQMHAYAVALNQQDATRSVQISLVFTAIDKVWTTELDATEIESVQNEIEATLLAKAPKNSE